MPLDLREVAVGVGPREDEAVAGDAWDHMDVQVKDGLTGIWACQRLEGHSGCSEL